MVAAIPRGDRDRQLGVLEMLGERFAFGSVRPHPSAKRDVHAVADSANCFDNISKPGPGPLYLLNHTDLRTLFLPPHKTLRGTNSDSIDR
jgi:hypothetical protein